MEYFGFGSAASGSGPSFPFLPESILKSYPAELLEHPVLPSLPPACLGMYDCVDLASVYKGLVDVLEQPLVRHASLAAVATAVVYGVWRVSTGWNEDLGVKSTSSTPFDYEVRTLSPISEHGLSVEEHDVSGLPVARYVKQVSGDGLDAPQKEKMKKSNRRHTSHAMGGDANVQTDPAIFKRELEEAFTQLDEVRLQVREMEDGRQLQEVEIEFRKKMIVNLQEENSAERDKRQQAELRMEMMEIEVSQLKQLRKELSVRTGQVERLEKFLKEKEELQQQLFQDNVVLPRTVAETRAKEFETLQARMQKLESEVDLNTKIRKFDTRCQPSKSTSCEMVSCDAMTDIEQASNDAGKDPQQAQDTCSAPVCALNNEFAGSSSSKLNRGHMPPQQRSYRKKSRPKLHHVSEIKTALSNKELQDRCLEQGSLEIGNLKVVRTSCSILNPTDEPSVDRLPSKKGVIAQLKAFIISRHKDSSSESDASKDHKECDEAVSGKIDPGGNSLWDDKANNHQVECSETVLSDEQSSVFVSASDGSAASDEYYLLSESSSSKTVCTNVRPVRPQSHLERGKMREKKIKSSPPKVAGSYLYNQRHRKATFAPEAGDFMSQKVCKIPPMVQCGKQGSLTESSDENESDSDDSWIVIVPATAAL